MELVRCPYGCGLDAEVIDRFVLESTDGPMEHVRTRCIYGHHYCGPSEGIESF